MLGLDPVTQAPGPAKNLVALACLPFSRSALDVFTAAAPHLQERTEDEFSGIATLAYQFARTSTHTRLYSRGHKAGGFNLDRVFFDAQGSIVSRPARRASGSGARYQLRDRIGRRLRSRFEDRDGRQPLQVNTAVFYQDFENFQLNTFTGIRSSWRRCPK